MSERKENQSKRGMDFTVEQKQRLKLENHGSLLVVIANGFCFVLTEGRYLCRDCKNFRSFLNNHEKLFTENFVLFNSTITFSESACSSSISDISVCKSCDLGFYRSGTRCSADDSIHQLLFGAAIK